MKHRLQILLVLACFAAPAGAFAQEAAAVTCKDESTSKGGKGACSHHGGVKQWLDGT